MIVSFTYPFTKSEKIPPIVGLRKYVKTSYMELCEYMHIRIDTVSTVRDIFVGDGTLYRIVVATKWCIVEVGRSIPMNLANHGISSSIVCDRRG